MEKSSHQLPTKGENVKLALITIGIFGLIALISYLEWTGRLG